uniref:DUF3778 domain-containing protein n=1 Tax=Oryza sativa subsp. japonica TaxID=39947 RepID=Q69ME1_ORYSJ|nr:hypothetical protein [Oryza sativa Japonica Group]BAD38555.1 hypothetical protein [Oryza sativa Japonica Group]
MAAVMVSGGGAERFEGLLMNQWMETSFGAAAGYKQCEAILGLLQRQMFYCTHLNFPVMLATCSLKSYFLWFQNSSIHTGSTVRVEHFLLLRSNGRLRGIIVLSPMMPTPKSTAQQLTSNLCHFCGKAFRSVKR